MYSTLKNSVADATKIVRVDADAAQTSLDNAKKRRVSIRNKQIAAVACYVVGVVGGVVAAAAIIQKTSTAEYLEDED